MRGCLSSRIFVGLVMFLASSSVLSEGKNLFASSNDVIVNLDASDFISQSGSSSTPKLKSNDLTFVNFHSSSCSHCISHAPIWVEFGKSLRISGAVAAALDCDDFRDLCTEFRVSGTPSIKVFKQGELVRNNVGEDLKDLFKVASTELGLALVVSGNRAIEAERLMRAESDSLLPKTIAQVSNMILDSESADANVKRFKNRLRNSKITRDPTKLKLMAVPSSKPIQNSYFSPREIQTLSPKAKVLHDAALSLRYSLEKGVFLGRFTLSLDEQMALINWLNILRRFFPTAVGRWQLDWLYEKTKAACETTLLSSKVFDSILEGWGFAKRFDQDYDWKHCVRADSNELASSSKPESGSGYTCGLWLLFHVISVSAAKSPHLLKEMDIPTSLHTFVKYFFSCNECRENFLKHNPTPPRTVAGGDPFAFALWLWREHNSVSKRLNHEDVTAGITNKPAREMFPSLELCSTCRRLNPDGSFEFDEGVVVRYLDFAFSGFSEGEELPFIDTSASNDSFFAFSAMPTRIASDLGSIIVELKWYLILIAVALCWLWKKKGRKLSGRWKGSKG